MYIKENGQEISLEINEEGKFQDGEGTSYHITHHNSGSSALAVFAGKIFKKLLGDYQPNYYLTSDDGRACNFLEGFADFQLSQNSLLSVEYQGGSYPFSRVKNFSAIIIAGYYLGEIDWDCSNIGLVPAKGADTNAYDLVAVRIDPGHSFQFNQVAAFNVGHFEEVLDDPFRMIIGGINYQAFKDGHTEGINDYYFRDLFKDLSAASDELDSSDEDVQLDSFSTTGVLAPLNNLGYKIPELKELLNNAQEIEEMMKKIIYLEGDLLQKLAEESGLNQYEIKKIMRSLQVRRSRFEDILKNNYNYSFSMSDLGIYFPDQPREEFGDEAATMPSISPFIPIVEPSTSDVELPEGAWYQYQEPMELDEVSAGSSALQLSSADNLGENENPQQPLVTQVMSAGPKRMGAEQVDLDDAPRRPKRKESGEELAKDVLVAKKRKANASGFFAKAPETNEEGAPSNDIVSDTSYKNP